MPKKIQNFATSALVKPITVNVGRAGAASLNIVQVNMKFGQIFTLLQPSLRLFYCIVQEVEFVKTEAKVVYILECLQKTQPPVLIFAERKSVSQTIKLREQSVIY